MTTVKIALKLILCFCLIFALASCKRRASDTQLPEALQSVEQSTAVEYLLVLPEDAPSALGDRARALCDSIKSETGSAARVLYDSDLAYLSETDDVYMIFIGNTEYSRAYLADLKNRDYIYRATEQNAFLGGVSYEATVAAIERFESDVLAYCDGKYIFEYQADFEFSAEYEIDTLLLCGREFSDYTFVCTDASSKRIADRLSELLCKRNGEYPNAFAQNGALGKSEIHLRLDKSASAATLMYDGEDVILSAPTSYALSVAAHRLYTSMLSNVSDGKAELLIKEPIICDYKEPQISVGAVRASLASFSLTASRIVECVQSADSDVMFLGEMDVDTWSVVRSEIYGDYQLHDGYATVEYKLQNGNVVAIAYKNLILRAGELTSASHDGMTELSLRLEYISDERAFALSVFSEHSTEQREAHMSTVKARISASNNEEIFLFVSADASALDTSVTDAYILCTEKSAVGESLYALSIVSKNEKLYKADAENISGESVGGLNVTLSQELSDGFSDLD